VETYPSEERRYLSSPSQEHHGKNADYTSNDHEGSSSSEPGFRSIREYAYQQSRISALISFDCLIEVGGLSRRKDLPIRGCMISPLRGPATKTSDIKDFDRPSSSRYGEAETEGSQHWDVSANHADLDAYHNPFRWTIHTTLIGDISISTKSCGFAWSYRSISSPGVPAYKPSTYKQRSHEVTTISSLRHEVESIFRSSTHNGSFIHSGPAT
jgi:hypothetical protein